MDEKEQAAQATEEAESQANDRAISSSGSSQPAAAAAEEGPPRPPSRPETSASKGRKQRPQNIDTGTSSHTRSISQLPELGPPLSPIKI